MSEYMLLHNTQYHFALLQST